MADVFASAAAQKRHVSSQGGDICYEDSGDSGSTSKSGSWAVLCLPGIGDLRQQYRFLGPLLHQHGFRVLVADLPGAAESSTKFASYTPEAVAIAIIHVLDDAKLDPKTKICVAGNSLAGAAAAVAAATHPERIQAVVLLCGIMRDLPGDKYFRPMSGLVFASPWAARMWLSYWPKLFQSRPSDFNAYSKALYRNLSQPGRPKALVRYIKAPKAKCYQSLRGVTCPVLAMYGDSDPDFRDVKAEEALIKAQLGASRLYESHVYEKVGHYPHVEQPQDVATRIGSFLFSAS